LSVLADEDKEEITTKHKQFYRSREN